MFKLRLPELGTFVFDIHNISRYQDQTLISINTILQRDKEQNGMNIYNTYIWFGLDLVQSNDDILVPLQYNSSNVSKDKIIYILCAAPTDGQECIINGKTDNNAINGKTDNNAYSKIAFDLAECLLKSFRKSELAASSTSL